MSDATTRPSASLTRHAAAGRRSIDSPALTPKPQRDAAVAQFVDEFVDQFAVDEVEQASAAARSASPATSSALKIVAYSTPMTPAPITVEAARQASAGRGSRRCRRWSCRRTACGRGGYGRVPHGDQDALAADTAGLAVRRLHLDRVRIDEARRRRQRCCTALRANWCSSTSTSWSSVMCRRASGPRRRCPASPGRRGRRSRARASRRD